MSAKNPPESRRALFLDRDGIINEDTGYPHRPDQIVFCPGIFDVCRAARDKGYILVVVTNQSGVARGKFTENDVRSLHRWMASCFEDEGAVLEGIYYCPYLADAPIEEYRRDSSYRKPGPGMFVQAAAELGIDLHRSLMVGDKPSDRIKLEGLRSIIVKSRYTDGDFDVESLYDVEALL